MADITSNMTFVRWLRARTELILDYSDDFLYAIMGGRGIEDDSFMLVDASEKQKDLCLADIYYWAAISSVKMGTQGESDGGWTHYVAIKNVVNRDGLMKMAKKLYDKWDEAFIDARPKIQMKNLY